MSSPSDDQFYPTTQQESKPTQPLLLVGARSSKIYQHLDMITIDEECPDTTVLIRGGLIRSSGYSSLTRLGCLSIGASRSYDIGGIL